MILENIGTFKIKPRPKPITQLGVSWSALESNNWRAIDLGSDTDLFDSQVTFIGSLNDMGNLLQGMQTIQFYITAELESGEENIFGADIDTSGEITIIPIKIGQLTRRDLVTYELPVLFRLIDPVPFDLEGSLSSLRFHTHSYTATRDFATTFLTTGGGGVYIMLHPDKDQGMFTATFLQKTEEMKQIRSFIRQGAGRTEAFTWTAPQGITDPFGPAVITPTYQTRIINWQDNGQLFVDWWTITLTFVEEY